MVVILHSPFRIVALLVAVLLACAKPSGLTAQIIIERQDDIEWVDQAWAEASALAGADGLASDSADEASDIVELVKSAGAQKVIGEDGREVVGDTMSFPWRTIGVITGSFEESDGSSIVRQGTGVLIGRKTVLTAAHVLVDDQRWANDVTFAPGQDGSTKPYGKISAVKKLVRRVYWDKESRDQDLGLMVLASSIGTTTDYMQIEIKPASFFWHAGLNVAGYPGDLGSTMKLYHAFGYSHRAVGTLVYHKIDTAAGQSGAPAWVYSEAEGTRRLVGVHVAGGSDFNYAVRIDNTFFDWINDYLEENDSTHYTTTDTSTGSSSESSGTDSSAPCAAAGALASMWLLLSGVALIRPTRRNRP